MEALKAHLAKSAFSERFTTLIDTKRFVVRCYPTLKVEEVEIVSEDGAKRWMIVCSTKYMEVAGGGIGPVLPARMVFSYDGSFSFEVLLKCVTSGSWLSSEPPHTEITTQLNTLLPNSKFILCPGIREYGKEFGESIRFQSKNLRVWTHPHQRHDSNQCLLWHKPSNFQLSVDSPLYGLCTNCKILYHDLQAIKKRVLSSSPLHKEKWTEPSSNHPLKYLSPASQVKKLARKGVEVRRLQKALSKFDDTSLDVEIRGDQGEEIQKLVAAIDQSGQEELQAIYTEANSVEEGAGDALREAWERDVAERKEFFEDQLKSSKQTLVHS